MKDDKNCRMVVVSDDDAGHLSTALAQLDVDVCVRAHPEDGIDRLDREVERASGPPHAIVLDVREREHDLLRALKASSALALVPVLVFLSDLTESRVRELYAAGASLVFLKPPGTTSLRSALRRLVGLWCEFVTPPPLPRPLY